MVPDAELAAEQDVVDEAYRRIDVMRDDARAMLDEVLDLGRGGTFQSRTERDVIVRTSLARLEQLDIGDQALLFGRIDTRTQPTQGADSRAPRGTPAGVETFHIGRLAVHGADNEPLVVDWRAPVAEPFYRATGRDPQGLLLRRHLAVEHRTVTGYEDERFDADADADADGGTGAPSHLAAEPAGVAVANGGLVEGDVPIGGPAALLAALGRARSGQMTDIVATIQREQDEIIRAPLGGVLVVQGGPGTGKTAVALHRAAYLLYTHRFPLERQGVLVVGPNPLFLRYIEQVLPSLGETGVTLSTISGIVPEVRVGADEPADVARLKGDARMATVLARAVRTRQRPLRRDVTVAFGAYTLRLDASETRRIVAEVKRRPGTHNGRRRAVEQAVAEVLADQLVRARHRRLGSASQPFGADRDGEEALDAADETTEPREVRRALRAAPEVRDALDRMWPRLSPHELLHDLFGAPPLVAAAARGVLTEDEQALLVRARSGSLEDVPWTTGDAALVDEARHLLGPRSGRAEDQPPSYGHIVVDEVQDLSPMQLRMLARRSLSGSMTVVGDIAQATAPWAARTWDDIVAHLPARRVARRVELTVSYRTPAEVLAVASRVLAVAAPELRPPRPVRRSGVVPRLVAVDDAAGPPAGSGLAATVARTAVEELAAVGDGRVAVLAPESQVAGILEALALAGVDAADPRRQGRGGLAAPLVVLGAAGANGLEFDAVVVVEPEALAKETAGGLRTVYVALTRPTRRLAVVYTGHLPTFLGVEGG